MHIHQFTLGKQPCLSPILYEFYTKHMLCCFTKAVRGDLLGYLELNAHIKAGLHIIKYIMHLEGAYWRKTAQSSYILKLHLYSDPDTHVLNKWNTCLIVSIQEKHNNYKHGGY